MKGNVTRVTFVKKSKHAYAHYLENIFKGTFLFQMMISFCENTIPGVFKVTRSKIKVTWVTFVINYVNSFYWTSWKLLIIKPEGNYPTHIRVSCLNYIALDVRLLKWSCKPHNIQPCELWFVLLVIWAVQSVIYLIIGDCAFCCRQRT